MSITPADTTANVPVMPAGTLEMTSKLENAWLRSVTMVCVPNSGWPTTLGTDRQVAAGINVLSTGLTKGPRKPIVPLPEFPKRLKTELFIVSEFLQSLLVTVAVILNGALILTVAGQVRPAVAAVDVKAAKKIISFVKFIALPFLIKL